MNEVVLFLIIIILFSPSIPEAKPVNDLTVVDLIHRDSPLSPFYNSSLTQTEVLQNAAMRSISRSHHLNFTADQGSSKVESILIPVGDYLMKIFIGHPPKEQLVIVDPASDLIWVQCLPCEDCFKQTDPIFNPRQSSTYEDVPCHSHYCALIEKRSCGRRDECRYHVDYGDKSTTIGDLAKDTISLSSTGSVYPPKILFGCGHYNIGRSFGQGSTASVYPPKPAGVVGLGGGYLSLVTQLRYSLGHIFSYCLLTPFTRSNGKMKFGNRSTMPRYASTTPFLYKADFGYHLTLDYVSVNEDVKLQAAPPVGGSLDVIIDIGSTLTILAQPLYDSFESAVANAIDQPALRQPPEPFRLCYKEGTIEDEEYPDITFHFRGADFHLHKDNAFEEVHGGITCLAILPSGNGVSILGSQAQENFKVEFDILRKTVSFARTDCTKD